MPNTTIDDLIDGDQGQEVDYNQLEKEVPQPQAQGVGIDLSFLKAPTGEGTVDDYMNHALNFNNSKGMARVLRGVTGLMGDLNLAIVDILIGALDVLKNNKKGTNANVTRGDVPIY